MKETLGALGTFIVVVAIILVVGCAGTFAYYKFAAVPIENAHTSAIRRTNQYSTSQVTALREYYDSYAQLDTDAAKPGATAAQIAGYREQQQIAVRRMREITDTLDPQDVPADIHRFLLIH